MVILSHSCPFHSLKEKVGGICDTRNNFVDRGVLTHFTPYDFSTTMEESNGIEQWVQRYFSDDDVEDVELDDLKTVATLGIGGFGRVNLVKHFDTEKVYALKILNKAHVKEMNQQEHVINERNILISVKCDFVVR